MFYCLENAFVHCRLYAYLASGGGKAPQTSTGALLLDPAGDFRPLDPLCPPYTPSPGYATATQLFQRVFLVDESNADALN